MSAASRAYKRLRSLYQMTLRRMQSAPRGGVEAARPVLLDRLEERVLLSGTASLSGLVYSDLDGDGSRDADESAVAQSLVYLDLDRSGSLEWSDQNGNFRWDEGEGDRWTIGDAQGRYHFDDLAADVYAVRLFKPDNLVLTEPAVDEVLISDSFEDGVIDSSIWVGNGNQPTIYTLGEPGPTGETVLRFPATSQVLETLPMDLSAASSLRVTYWWMQGGLEDDPEFGDDIWLEYLDADGEFVQLYRHYGYTSETDDLRQNIVEIDGDLLHDGFVLRFHNRAVSYGVVETDDWFIDDIRVSIPGEQSSLVTLEEGGSAEGVNLGISRRIAPGSPYLLPSGDTGRASDDGITMNNNGTQAERMAFQLDHVAKGETVHLVADNGVDPELILATPVVTTDGTFSFWTDGRTALPDGTYSIRARVLSSFGTWESVESVHPLVVDSEAPRVTVDEVSADTASFRLSGTVSEAGTLVEVALADRTYTPTVAPDLTWEIAAYIFLENGRYDVMATATDRAGNVGSDTTTDELEIVDPSGSISGTVWKDLNDNGVVDEGESGLEGVRVYLNEDDDLTLDWTDQNANGLWDSGEGERWITTDAEGFYRFDRLVIGPHQVLIDAPAGFVQSNPIPHADWSSTYQSASSTVGKIVDVGPLDSIFFMAGSGSIGQYNYETGDYFASVLVGGAVTLHDFDADQAGSLLWITMPSSSTDGSLLRSYELGSGAMQEFALPVEAGEVSEIAVGSDGMVYFAGKPAQSSAVGGFYRFDPATSFATRLFDLSSGADLTRSPEGGVVLIADHHTDSTSLHRFDVGTGQVTGSTSVWSLGSGTVRYEVGPEGELFTTRQNQVTRVYDAGLNEIQVFSSTPLSFIDPARPVLYRGSGSSRLQVLDTVSWQTHMSQWLPASVNDIPYAAITGDGSKLFYSRGSLVYIMENGTGEVRPLSLSLGESLTDHDFALAHVLLREPIDLGWSSDTGSSQQDNITRYNNADDDHRLQFIVDHLQVVGAVQLVASDGVNEDILLDTTIEPAENNGTITTTGDVVLPDGTYDLRLSVLRDAETWFSGMVAATVTIDATPLVVTIDAVETDRLDTVITGTVDGDAHWVSVSFNGRTYQATVTGDGTWSAEISVEGYTPGVYDIEAEAVDVAGNTSTDTTTGELTILNGTNTLTGSVWHDLDGSKDEVDGEPRMANVRVYLDSNRNDVLDWLDGDDDGLWDAGEGERWVLTGADGSYSFDQLPEGRYEVKATTPVGYTATLTPDTDWGAEHVFSDRLPEKILFAPDGVTLYTIQSNNEIRRFDMATMTQLSSYVLPAASIDSFDLSPDGTFLIASTQNGAANHQGILWMVSTQTHVVIGEYTFDLGGFETGVSDVHIDSDGHVYVAPYTAIGLGFGTGPWLLRKLDLQTGAFEVIGNSDVANVTFGQTHDPAQILMQGAINNRSDLALYDTVTDRFVLTSPNGLSNISQVSISPDGQTLAYRVGSAIRLVDRSFNVLTTINTQYVGVFDPNLPYYYTQGSGNESLHVLDASTGATVDSYRAPYSFSYSPTSMTISADGTRIAYSAQSSYNIYYIYALNNGKAFEGVVVEGGGTTAGPDFGFQRTVKPAAPDLRGETDTGTSTTDNLTRRNNGSADETLMFALNGLNAADEVTLLIFPDEGVPYAIGSGVALGAGAFISTDGQTVLEDGTHPIGVQITDRYNTFTYSSPTTHVLSVTIDTIAPVVDVDPLVTDQIRPALSGTLDDTFASVEITLGELSVGAGKPTSTTWQVGAGVFGPLAVGLHDVVARATDRAGNVGIDTTVRELEVITPTAELAGTVWHDLNNDGVFDADEPTLTGVRVYLDDNNNSALDWFDYDLDGSWDANEGERWQLTDDEGNYRFAGLISGGYTVRQQVMDPYVLTAPFGDTVLFEETFETTSFDPSRWAVVSHATIDDVGIDEPSEPYALRLNGDPSYSDYVDTVPIDLSGLANVSLEFAWQQTGGGHEPGYNDNLVVSYLNRYNGRYTLRTLSGSTTGAGTPFGVSQSYLPSSACHDDFSLRFYASDTQRPAGDWFVDDVRLLVPGDGGHRVELDVGERLEDLDFGNFAESVAEGTVWMDLNKNGVRQASDPLLENIRVYLDLDGNGVFDDTEPSVLTDDSGQYRFDEIITGAYSLRVDLPSEYLTVISPEAGVYTFTVYSDEYVGGLDFGLQRTSPFGVVSSDPALGEFTGPDTDYYFVTFNGEVNSSTVQASDFLVDGQHPAGVYVSAPDTVRITLPGTLSSGLHNVILPENRIEDVWGVPNTIFTGFFAVDATGPRIISSSIVEGQELPVGDVTLMLAFDESMGASSVENLDAYALRDSGDNLFVPDHAVYYEATKTAVVRWRGLEEEFYRLAIADSLTDVVGNRLDGEAAWPLPVEGTGDGVPGGAFTVRFTTDVQTSQKVEDWRLLEPVGSHAARAEQRALLGRTGDVDRYTLDVASGNVFSVLARTEDVVRYSLRIVDPSGDVLRLHAGEVAGSALATPVRATETGTYTIELESIWSAGRVDLEILLNGVFEAEEHDDSTNHTADDAQDLSTVFTPLPGTDVQQVKVLGAGEDHVDGHDVSRTQRISGTAYYPNNLYFTFDDLPQTVGDGVLTFVGWGDFDQSNEYAIVTVDNVIFSALVFDLPGYHSNPVTDTISVTQDDLDALLADGSVTLSAGFSTSVSNYGGSYLEVTLSYPSIPPTADWYRVSLEDGESLNLLLESDQVQSGAAIRVYDTDMVEQQATLTAGGKRIELKGFADTTTDGGADDYFVEVTGVVGAYELLVTRNAAIALNGSVSVSADHAEAGVRYVGGVMGPEPEETTKSPVTPPTGASGDEPLLVGFDNLALGQLDAEVYLSSLGLSVLDVYPMVGSALVQAPRVSLLGEADGVSWVDDPAIRYVEPDGALRLHQTLASDPYFGSLWGLHNTGQSFGTHDADIDAPEAWSVFTGTSDVVVAIIDSGIDYNHPDLADNMWRNPGEIPGNGIDDDNNGYVDDVYGIDAANNDSDPMDDNSHGTHVAGTIGAVGNNGIGITGVNWDVEMMALKFLDRYGDGNNSDVIELIDYMVDMKLNHGINIVASNNSWGGSLYSSALMDAIEASNDAGILFVASSGNDRVNTDISGRYPHGYNLPGILAVGSTDRNDRLSSFSNYGVQTVDIAAPGTDIYSTVPGGSYGYKSGTSMASPHVTGAAAMLMAANPNASIFEIKQLLMDTADSVSELTGKIANAGRLNLNTAIQTIGLHTEELDTYTLYMDPGDTIRVSTLTPGDEVGPLVNHLDPMIEIRDAANELLAFDDNSAADGRNAELVYRAEGAGTMTVVVKAAEGTEGIYLLDLSVERAAEVVNTELFYNNSSFDQNDPELNEADLEAIAEDKYPLKPGSEARFTNYTSYDRGINGLMIDISNLKSLPTLSDFVFMTGRSQDASEWTEAPLPTAMLVSEGIGRYDSDRISFSWEDGAITNTWLRVRALSDDNGGSLGLGEDAVFYYGNVIGESGNRADTVVDIFDMLAPLRRIESGGRGSTPNTMPVEVTHPFDYNRDQVLDEKDMAIARGHGSTIANALPLMRAPDSIGSTISAAPPVKLNTRYYYRSFVYPLAQRPDTGGVAVPRYTLLVTRDGIRMVSEDPAAKKGDPGRVSATPSLPQAQRVAYQQQPMSALRQQQLVQQ
ncbi:S8 family serine peptidase [Mucisphaera calidilacus]|uniref:Thermophilic serine proteinase n=1 Tax=Mucisphaera calidilacus TaxID=2527982 RepID=A0A518BY18_9BACT|nr:S8 family serine peptidase [Mucisphaera calidilacus]QDU71862.1 Thermophilic serine proteinase precursor [Mucisphaera calidilacus]